jgi:peroxiredoxin (alkyl hydroperoxide reductase subunit C)
MLNRNHRINRLEFCCTAHYLPLHRTIRTREERRMISIGSNLKPFTAAGYVQGKFVQVTENDVIGKWAIFFFYPADFTFVCPTELEDMADLHGEFARLGVEIYSVSTDTHFSHKAWAETSPAVGKIRFTMLGDPSGQLTNNFGVMREGVGLADRATFLVDPDGVVQYVEVTSEGVGRNAAELLRKVKAAAYVREHPNEVCPAKWEEGETTLAPSLDLVGKI